MSFTSIQPDPNSPTSYIQPTEPARLADLGANALPDPTLPAKNDYAPTGIRRDEAFKAGQTLLNAGIPLRQVQEALAADGFTGFGIDSRSPQERQRDDLADLLAPSAPAPADYAPDYGGNGRANAIEARVPGGVVEFDKNARAWCAAIGVPAGVGKDLIERIVDYGLKSENLSPEQRERRELESQPTFVHLASKRGISVEQMKQQASSILAKGGAKLPSEAEVLNDPWIVVALSDHASNLAAAAKLRGGR